MFGKVLIIHALVNYEGETATELQAAFREALENYLATCQELEPEALLQNRGG